MAAVTVPRALGDRLRAKRLKWLVTGSAGFIGSHLLEQLLLLDQQVVSLDNFATGHSSNLDEVREHVGAARWTHHQFIHGDIVDVALCRAACSGVDVVLHQAALGSVPRSLENPLATHASNATGFLNMLVAAREASVGRFVYAASSSTYGDSPSLPKVEDVIGRPLSPYAVTKYLNELYADVFGRAYGMGSIGLRYFNVFGVRQDPNGAYAAVIPRWASQILKGEPCVINGDGETSRDFCYIANVVQANLLAATEEAPEAVNQVYNIAFGERTTLNTLHRLIGESLQRIRPQLTIAPPQYGSFRPGDVRHSLASIDKARALLGYAPSHDVRQGMSEAVPWYAGRSQAAR